VPGIAAPAGVREAAHVDRPSMYDAAGGDGAFLSLATAFHQRCLDDDLLEHPFSHAGHPQHVERLAAYWAEVLGGPPTFSETCGDQSSMQVLHSGNDAPREMGTRFLACFLAAIDDAGLPDDPDLRAGLRAYMEWAVDDVMAYTPKGSEVPAGLAMPHWSWEGLIES
jgi:hemoglobin